MLAAKDKGEPPPQLQMRWRCRTWGALPRDAGMNGQSYRDIRLMETLSSVYDTVKAWRRGKLTPHDLSIIKWLGKNGLM